MEYNVSAMQAPSPGLARQEVPQMQDKQGKRGARVWKWLGIFAQIVLAVFCLYQITASSHIHIKQIEQPLVHLSWSYLLLGITCFVVVMIFSALRYYLLLPKTVPLRYLLATSFVQNALLSFLPWRLGEVSYPFLLRRDYNIPIAQSTALIIMIRVVDLLVVLAVAATAGPQLGLPTQWLLLIMIVGLLVFCGVALYFRKHQMPRRFTSAVTALEGLQDPRRFFAFMLLSTTMFVLTTLQSVFILRAMALGISFRHTAILNALGLIIGLLPIHPPGGWGTMDSLQTLLLDRLGYREAQALPSILAAHSVYTVLIFIGGILGWLLLKQCRPRVIRGA